MMAHDDKLSMSLQDKIQIHERAKSTAKELEVLMQIQCQYQTHLDEEKNNSYRADDVDKLIQRIYKLPMKGNDLRKAMEEEEKTRRSVVESITSEIINLDLARWYGQARDLFLS